ncbi:MAG: Asp-tRNA(Asn)/Glu-tRNA(Gln) amidotransferase subunit GatB [Candidatus Velamenicoccus archaeovorus]
MAGTLTTQGYETVIGLECHVELATETKMFCGCRNAFGAEPNTNVCPVCLGLPGSLPVPNQRAIEYIVRIGLALNCRIAPHSLFHRKNYFYPDMPKDFQISQYDLPICVGGYLDIEVDGEVRRIGITRVHMEEDTGKTTHLGGTGRIARAEAALVDYNRAGVPLVEVVSEPDLRSPEEARAYLVELRATLEALGVSDVRMEEGSLRCDANVSVRRAGAEDLGTKVEIKNLNSVRSLERALRYEQERQVAALERGEPLVQETRHFDEDEGSTHTLRSKEEAFDYRYFPEPDLPPLEPDPAWVEQIRASLPELPAARRTRLIRDHGLKPEQAAIVGADRHAVEYLERAVGLGASAGAVATWMTQDVAAYLNRTGRAWSDLERDFPAERLRDLLRLVEEGVLSSTGGKTAFEEAVGTGKHLDQVIEENGLRQVSDTTQLEAWVDEAIAENPGLVEQFRGGKEGVLNALVGQVMKRSRGSANPKVTGDLLRARLSGS